MCLFMEPLHLQFGEKGEQQINYILCIDFSNAITWRTLKQTNGRALPLIRGVSGAEQELCDPL